MLRLLPLVVLGLACGDNRGAHRHATGPGGNLQLDGAQVILGNIDEAEILAALDRAMPRLAACYKRRLADDPGLAGVVSIRFFIGEDGEVADASVLQSELNDSSMETCLLARLAGISFPRPRDSGSAAVTARFLARPLEGEGGSP